MISLFGHMMRRPVAAWSASEDDLVGGFLGATLAVLFCELGIVAFLVETVCEGSSVDIAVDIIMVVGRIMVFSGWGLA